MEAWKAAGDCNAWCTGCVRAKRLWFLDARLAGMAAEGIEAVLAHELGHFRLRHVIKRVLWSAVFSLALLGLRAWLAQAPWFHIGVGIPVADVAIALTRPGVALALIMLALTVFLFGLAPLSAACSRRH